jgi:small-conductance mechanosensitive channel
MRTDFSWLAESWTDIVIPLAVFFAALIAAFWLRRGAYDRLENWSRKSRWPGDETLVQATRSASVLWCFLLSAYLALAVSKIPAGWKGPTGRGLGTLLLLSLAMVAINLASRFIRFYGERLKLPPRPVSLTTSIVRVTILVIAGLILLDIWGVPTSPILLVIVVAVLAGALALRDVLPSAFAGLQLSASGHIKVGDYIKLETGEEGYVTEMDWRHTRIKALDESIVLIPNTRLLQSTVINYGRPLKRAEEPFRFYTRAHLKELTGLKASNLRQMVEILKDSPDSVVYYHTHNFLEEHHYLTPEPANDFALWVSDALGDEVLGERLASVDVFDLPSLGAIRERLVNIMEEHLSRQPNGREAPEGRDFHFIKSVSVILPTPYVAHDLREFVEALRKVSLGSLYYHIFESRLRLGRGLNDLSIWLEERLEEKELAERIARLDPYTYTLEGLKSSLIQLIEKRIK